MTTFSQLVDSLITEHLRPDLRSTIESYVNLTIRELHSAINGGGVVLYAANLKELQVTTDVADGFVWDLPRPHLFQKIAAVRFDTYGRGPESYAIERSPGAMGVTHMLEKYYYRSGQSFSFVNYGPSGSTISIAWFEVPTRLKYYATADRPCVWDDATQAFTFASAYSVSQSTMETGYGLCSNWVLDRWEDLVAQGARTKIFARLSDEVRSRLSYSVYQQGRADMVSAETYASGVF